MLGQKSLGTESLQAFRQACQGTSTSQSYHQHRGITNPAERGWQTIQPHGQHVPAENLIKQQWLAVLFAAVVMDRTLPWGQ
jgi:hypothetical protein